jgi:hypothetical protein
MFSNKKDFFNSAGPLVDFEGLLWLDIYSILIYNGQPGKK